MANTITNIVSTLTRKYTWYASSVNTSTDIPAGATSLYSNATGYTDNAKLASYIIKKGLVGSYIWVKCEMSAPGYESVSAVKFIGPVTANQITPAESWAGLNTELKAGVTIDIKPTTEFSQTYSPATYGVAADNSTQDSESLQAAYAATVNKEYHWVVYAATAEDPTADTYTSTSTYTEFSTSADATIPSYIIVGENKVYTAGKKVACVVIYSLSTADDADYDLTSTSAVKVYATTIKATNLVYTFSDYTFPDTNLDTQKGGIHDSITCSITGATDDNRHSYSLAELKSMVDAGTIGAPAYTWTLSGGDTYRSTAAEQTITDDGFTCTIVMDPNKGLVGQTLKLSAASTDDGSYETVSGDKGTSVSPSVKVARVDISIGTASTSLVYGHAVQPLATDNNVNIYVKGSSTADTDITYASNTMYYAFDTELTDTNYKTTGTPGVIPTIAVANKSALDAGTHTLYVYFAGDADHDDASASRTFSIAKAPRTITVYNSTKDAEYDTETITYGDGATYYYKINQASDNGDYIGTDTSDVTVTGSLNNIQSITTTGTTTSDIAGNTFTAISASKVSAYSATNNTITISAAETTNYQAATTTFAIATAKRNITVATSTIDDTTPVYNDIETVTYGATGNYGFSDTEAQELNITYQWYEADSLSAMTAGTGTAIDGATLSTYTPTAAQADAAKAIYCVVTYTLTTDGAKNYTVDSNAANKSYQVSTTAVVAKRTMSLALDLASDAIYGQTLTATATVADTTNNTK